MGVDLLHRDTMPAVQIMRRRYLLLLPLALFGSGCAASGPRVEPVTVIAVAEPVSATKPVASVDAPSAPASTPCEEGFSALYVRFEASPRSAAFDAAARAFDRATEAYSRGFFADAARGFMKAAEGFLTAKDVSDRRWSYGNAISAWERTNHVGEGRMLLLDAATHDPELADELRAMVLDMSPVCPTAGP